MAVRKTPKRAVKKVASSSYIATAKVLGRFFTATGATIQDAIKNLEPGNVRGIVILTLEKDGKKQEKVLPRIIASRLFSASPTMREIALKQVCGRFDI